MIMIEHRDISSDCNILTPIVSDPYKHYGHIVSGSVNLSTLLSCLPWDIIKNTSFVNPSILIAQFA